ncbi:hypothetical protein OZ410_03720 [Robiginitalea sp. M366]|uniref:hypothetical protein n=1 Tax=Robiginitalea aestuariiviva TaxID=3036903 RepID=UPI00240DEECC|nr:hypothetical protein [Robiginitalea aestuariiviva]MDG1571409.1 hypothetical protein [Robiginitalea aestuariiviva]
MKREKRLQLGFIAGVVLVLLGTLDPLEGSLLIALGAGVLAWVTHSYQDPHARYYKMAAGLIGFGVAALWLLSALGGFGGKSTLANGWAVLLLPYPAGWLMLLGLFYLRLFVKRK